MSAEPIRPLVITSPVEVGPDDHVAKVATVFVERAIRTVAVTSGDVLIGTLSRADICRALVAW
jgi:predicted transcriptional regulator